MCWHHTLGGNNTESGFFYRKFFIMQNLHIGILSQNSTMKQSTKLNFLKLYWPHSLPKLKSLTDKLKDFQKLSKIQRNTIFRHGWGEFYFAFISLNKFKYKRFGHTLSLQHKCSLKLLEHPTPTSQISCITFMQTDISE